MTKMKPVKEVINRVIVSDPRTGEGHLDMNKILVNPGDLSGHMCFVDNRELTIGKGNIVTIPEELMEEIGYLREDGRYAVPLYINFRHVDGKLAVGGGLIRGPGLGPYLERIQDGKPLSRAAIIEDPESLEVLQPADIPEWTQSGDDA